MSQNGAWHERRKLEPSFRLMGMLGAAVVAFGAVGGRLAPHEFCTALASAALIAGKDLAFDRLATTGCAVVMMDTALVGLAAVSRSAIAVLVLQPRSAGQRVSAVAMRRSATKGMAVTLLGAAGRAAAAL